MQIGNENADGEALSSQVHAINDLKIDTRRILPLTPEGQLAFWTALNAPTKLTPNQMTLSAMMRGEE